MEKVTCEVCGKVMEGHLKTQVDYYLQQHKLSKHSKQKVSELTIRKRKAKTKEETKSPSSSAGKPSPVSENLTSLHNATSFSNDGVVEPNTLVSIPEGITADSQSTQESKLSWKERRLLRELNEIGGNQKWI